MSGFRQLCQGTAARQAPRPPGTARVEACGSSSDARDSVIDPPNGKPSSSRREAEDHCGLFGIFGHHDAVELADAGALAPTLAITVQRKAGEQFDRVAAYRLGDKPPRLDSAEQLPEYVPACASHADRSAQDDSVPF